MGLSFTAFTVNVNVSLSVRLPVPSSVIVTVISALPFCSANTSKVNVPVVPSPSVVVDTRTRDSSLLTALYVNV